MVEEQNKVQILLQEYASLRTEIVHRTNNMFQLISVGAVIFGLGVSGTSWYRIGVDLAVGALAVWYFRRLIARDIRKAATRLREIERSLNSRAGETLLVWETYFGGDVTGWWGRGEELPRPAPAADRSSN